MIIGVHAVPDLGPKGVQTSSLAKRNPGNIHKGKNFFNLKSVILHAVHCVWILNTHFHVVVIFINVRRAY